MNERNYRLPVKAAAVLAEIVLVLTALIFGAGAGGVTLLAGESGTLEEARRVTAEPFLFESADNVDWDYEDDGDLEKLYGDANFYYTVTGADGQALAGNYTGQAFLTSVEREFYDYAEYKAYYGDEEDWENSDHMALVRTVTLYAKTDMTRNDWMSAALRMVEFWYGFRLAALGLAGVLLLLALGLLVYLCTIVGYHPGQEKPVCNPFDRIPFDLFTGLYGCLIVFELVMLDSMGGRLIPSLCWLAVCAVADVPLLLWYILSLTTRIKTGTLWHNTVIAWFFRLIGRGVRALPLVWKSTLLLVAAALAELILLGMWGTEDAIAVWFFANIVLIPAALAFIARLRRLQEGCRRIAAGQLDYQVNTAHLHGHMLAAAKDLNHIRDGMSRAVEAKVKSERFKTELITNVSHDIKTPLTSIINYVDLLKKEQPESDTMREYLEVLDRQSSRLKKLIEDLVEASKASTGNLAVNLTDCELGVLLEQTAGEYAEKTAAARLELIINRPEQPVRILADGRHLWRVLDNLMNNVCKYAQPGTRVYVDLAQAGNEAKIVFRNVSRCALNISGEELMERFVRGDSSRNTEGSGLGLSIARSLTELQHGRLELVVDGDLFKVILTFPALPETTVTASAVTVEG